MSKQNIMKQLRDIREKVSLDTVGMSLEELQAYLKARGTLKESMSARPARRSAKPPVRRRTKTKA
jgi:hypothetical protein